MGVLASDLIDLDRYPIAGDPVVREAVVARVRAALDADGCAVLKGFLSARGVAEAVDEASAVSDKAYRSFSRSNPYFTRDDPALAPHDPRRRFFERSNAFVPADNFAPEGALRTVFDAPGFDAFIRDCLGVAPDRFFRYADPLADVIVNLAEAGNGFPWHFDTNNFTVTLALQNAEAGGAFEYAPNIRSAQDENFDEVERVLDGRSARVKVLNLEPGDLQLFRGRYSLHRVAPLQGDRLRLVAIYSYVDQPGMVGSVERTRQLYGRILPIHEAAARRSDALLD